MDVGWFNSQSASHIGDFSQNGKAEAVRVLTENKQLNVT